MLSDEDFDNDLKQDAGFAFQEISSKRNRRKASFTIDLQKLRKKHQKSLSKYLRPDFIPATIILFTFTVHMSKLLLKAV